MNAVTTKARHVDTRWFQHQLSAAGLSQRRLAKLMQIDHSALSQLFHGKREMRATEAIEIARHLNIPASEVLRHAGLQVSDDRTVPVIGHLDAEAEAHMGESEFRVEGPPDLPAGSSALIWQTAGTALEMLDGLTVFMGKPGPVTPEHVGRWCIVGMTGGCAMFRHVRRGYRPDRYNLLLTFSANIQDVALDWAATCYWIRL